MEWKTGLKTVPLALSYSCRNLETESGSGISLGRSAPLLSIVSKIGMKGKRMAVKTILITGVSSGFGAALAEEVIKRAGASSELFVAKRHELP